MIHVTQGDIDLGCQRSDGGMCPIERALARQYPQFKTYVTTNAIRVRQTQGQPGATYPLPIEAMRFVRGFDRHGPEAVKPFSFEAHRLNWVIEKKMEQAA